MPCIAIRKASFEIYDFVMMAILVARTKLFTILSSLLLVFPYLLIVGCVAPHPAPVVESQRNLHQTPDKLVVTTDKQIYIVQRGDTLYGIALKHGIDYRELAQWNGIVDPNALRIGQEIDLSVPSRQKSPSHQAQVMVEQQVNTAQPTLFSVPQPILSSDVEQPPSPISQSDIEVSAGSLVTEPKGVKLPYSETAVAQLRDSASPSGNAPSKVETVAMAPVTQKIKIDEKESIPPKISSQKPETGNASNIKWSWPTNGQVLSRYTEKSKGVSISGRPGQSILASADGTVVYSGSGLRGYGKLIIVKHNDTYLSAYGHNSKILVREGEAVTKGQKIAEMGNTDSDTVKLHFEIRERGKPVDPLKFLSN